MEPFAFVTVISAKRTRTTTRRVPTLDDVRGIVRARTKSIKKKIQFIGGGVKKKKTIIPIINVSSAGLGGCKSRVEGTTRAGPPELKKINTVLYRLCDGVIRIIIIFYCRDRS